MIPKTSVLFEGYLFRYRFDDLISYLVHVGKDGSVYDNWAYSLGFTFSDAGGRVVDFLYNRSKDQLETGKRFLRVFNGSGNYYFQNKTVKDQGIRFNREGRPVLAKEGEETLIVQGNCTLTNYPMGIVPLPAKTDRYKEKSS